jgi:hypothetical protein
MANTSRVTRISTMVTRRMVVACTGPHGEPDLFFCRITGNPNKMLDGKQYPAARKFAKSQDMGSPMVAFDCTDDTAGRAMESLFSWGTATEISI